MQQVTSTPPSQFEPTTQPQTATQPSTQPTRPATIPSVSRSSMNVSLRIGVLCVLLYALGSYAYATVRFVGASADSDTAGITRIIHEAQTSESLLRSSEPYGNGFSYQAITMVVLRFTGVGLQSLQLHIYPLVTAGLSLVMFVAYRALTRNSWIALLATLMLFMQPDFLYVTWRGSHEKFTWSFVLVLWFLLAKSFQQHGFGRYVILYYLVGFALVCTNAFFASSFVTTLLISCIGGLVLFRLRGYLHQFLPRFVLKAPEGSGESDTAVQRDMDAHQHVRRMVYVTASTGILLYVFFFHLYPPSLSLLHALGSLVDKLKLLVLNTERAVTISNDVYDYVSLAWIDTRIYLALMLFSLLIAAFSGLVWLVGIAGFLRRPTVQRDHLPRLLLWLIYPTFALQLVGSLFVDRTGEAGGNLQVRMFTPLMLVAIPMIVIGIRGVLNHLPYRLLRLVLVTIISVTMMLYSVMGLLKLTNEPLLSNNWVFTTTAERIANEWVQDHSGTNTIWAGIDWRMTLGSILFDMRTDPRRITYGPEPSVTTRYFLFSDVELEKWRRWMIPLPYFDEDNLIYVNGTARVYYRHPGVGFPIQAILKSES